MDRRERINDTEEPMRMALESHQAQIWTATPGIVTAVQLDKQTVSVQPAIMAEFSDATGTVENKPLPLLVDVPIVWPRAGGFALTFPIAIDDEVLVVFASRCMDSWWQSGGVQTQVEFRMHDLSDGFAILAPTSQPKKLLNVSANNVQLRDNAGTTYLEIEPGGKINLIASTEIKLTAPNVKIIGKLTHTGGTLTNNTITDVWQHKHRDTQPGTGNTGVPVN